MRLQRLMVMSLVGLLGLAGCAVESGQSGQRWRAYRDGDLPVTIGAPALPRLAGFNSAAGEPEQADQGNDHETLQPHAGLPRHHLGA